jgi:hypothetical protein
MAVLFLLFLLTVSVVSADEGNKLLSLCFHGFIAFS